MKNIKILVCDPLDQEGMQLLQKAGFQVDSPAKLAQAELIKKIPDYTAVLVRSATKITGPVIRAGKNLKLIGRAGVGVDNIEVAEATRHGIIVMNAPNANVTTTAELAISHLLCLARKLHVADRSVRAGKWEKSRFTGTEVRGKTLGIIGLGRIGRATAERGLGLKMHVLAFDPFLKIEDSPVPGTQLTDLETLLRGADFVSIHTPLNEHTKNLINKKAISLMKPSAMIINCARGGIVNEQDLYEALKEGQLAAAGLDVFATEPPGKLALFELENALFTPHLGASTDEAQRQVSIDLAQQVIDYFASGAVINSVNAPSLAAEVSVVLRPYVALGQKLGSFIAQLHAQPVQKIEITFRGEIHALDLALVRAAILVGLLQHSLEAHVNLINAPLLAEERGIKVLEAREAKAIDYLNSISVRATLNGNKSTRVTGSVFGNRPRFVDIDGFSMDAIPEGNLLITHHQDCPGVIGKIGSILGAANINISRLQLGNSNGSKEVAIGVLNIDSPLPGDVLHEVQKIPNILEARYVRL